MERLLIIHKLLYIIHIAEVFPIWIVMVLENVMKYSDIQCQNSSFTFDTRIVLL